MIVDFSVITPDQRAGLCAIIAGLAIGLLMGCAEIPPKTIYYDRPLQLKRVICASESDVEATCAGGPKDDGHKLGIVRMPDKVDEYGRTVMGEIIVERPGGCYFPGSQTEVVKFKDCPTEIKQHEDCHAQGYKPWECDGYPWKKARPR